ncbi:MAG: hypothetical protein WBB28_17505 [Crinalium sp.]
MCLALLNLLSAIQTPDRQLNLILEILVWAGDRYLTRCAVLFK